jgi:hypothetical protein
VVHRDPRGGLYRQPLRVVVGGDLASYPLANLAVGTYWFRRDAAPEPSIRLVARRLDAPGDVEFEAIGYELGQRGLPQGWDAGWYYRTSVHELDRFPLPAGCWRVLLVDGRAGDSIVYEFPRPRLPDVRG